MIKEEQRVTAIAVSRLASRLGDEKYPILSKSRLTSVFTISSPTQSKNCAGGHPSPGKNRLATHASCSIEFRSMVLRPAVEQHELQVLAARYSRRTNETERLRREVRTRFAIVDMIRLGEIDRAARR